MTFLKKRRSSRGREGRGKKETLSSIASLSIGEGSGSKSQAQGAKVFLLELVEEGKKERWVLDKVLLVDG